MSNKYVTLKTFFIIILFLFCFILLSLLSVIHFFTVKEKEMSIPVRTIQHTARKNDKSETEEYINDIIYVVAEHNGKIGIYDPNRTTVFEILDVYVDYLPDADKRYLQNGINIYTNDELLSVIADYTG